MTFIFLYIHDPSTHFILLLFIAEKRKGKKSPAFFNSLVPVGNRRDPLFRNAGDFQAFLHILVQLHEKFPFEIASYCLMNNHYHLQTRSSKIPFSKLMSLINKRYANYYNTKYRLTGHVFEKRYYDQLIEDKQGMLEVSRYIHLNPVKAKGRENRRFLIDWISLSDMMK